MPVSHFNLNVSHIPSATSFYLSALQPLGYHYVGQQGDSIGLGIYDADFFLTQQALGATISPTHIAFSAANRLAVRNCYAAALNAGGRPSGAPSYRNDDCSCFNAAVTDMDGNTLEFIFREGVSQDHHVAPSKISTRVLAWQKNAVGNAEAISEASYGSKMSAAKSRARTALDLASATSKSVKGTPSATGIAQSRTEPMGIDSKALIGTVLGAAAGAAFAYAMVKSEQDNRKEEARFADSMTYRGRNRDDRAMSNSASSKPSRRSASAVPARTTHRNFSVTESARSLLYTAPPMTFRAIEPAGRGDDTELQDALSRYTQRRPQPTRSSTYDSSEHEPVSVSPKSQVGRSRYSAKRSATMPQQPTQYLLENPNYTRSPVGGPSQYGEAEDLKLRRHDSGVSVRSHHSKRSGDERRSSASNTSTVKPARRGSNYVSAAGIPLPASNVPSAAPRRQSSYVEGDERRSSASRASTLKPSKRESGSRAQSYFSARDIPIPASHTASENPAREMPLFRSVVYSAAAVPLPASLANDKGYDDAGDESDGLGDTCTVVPDDSISCVDFSAPRRPSAQSRRSHASRREGEKRDIRRDRDRDRERADRRGSQDARSVSTVKLARSKISAATMPVRSQDRDVADGGRRRRSVFD